jgi:hypothetical protein
MGTFRILPLSVAISFVRMKKENPKFESWATFPIKSTNFFPDSVFAVGTFKKFGNNFINPRFQI